MSNNDPEINAIPSLWKRLRLTMIVVFLFFSGYCFYGCFTKHFMDVWRILIKGENGDDPLTISSGYEMLYKGLFIFSFGCYFLFMAWYINRSEKHFARGLVITFVILGSLWLYATYN